MTEDDAVDPAAELQQGLFTLIISLIQYYRSNGQTKEQACAIVAGLLEEYARVIRNPEVDDTQQQGEPNNA